MGACSSGEDVIVKVRKPYTITKQREKWTEDEHIRFLEALKLYGRAWQRIEEHIRTKTAVQIRSHAQKFFTKLEKEATAKGLPFGEVHDIDIPPPRPKKKPNNPYPRKICVGAVSSCIGGKIGNVVGSLSSSCPDQKAIQLERNAICKIMPKDSKCPESCPEDEQCLLIPPSRGPSNASLREFVPMAKEIEDKVTDKMCCYRTEQKISDGTKMDGYVQMENEGGRSKTYPKHAPVNSISDDGSGSLRKRDPDPTNLASTSNSIEIQTDLNIGTIPSNSPAAGHHDGTSVSSVHHPFVAYSPFTHFISTQHASGSFLDVQSTFSSLLLSTLLPNPAAHSAASFAASLWPTNAETTNCGAWDAVGGGIPIRNMSLSSSMGAIATATVSAASAWWATHGMLPFCHPFQGCFSFAPTSTTVIPPTEVQGAQATENNEQQVVEAVNAESQRHQQSFVPETFVVSREMLSSLLLSGPDDCQDGGKECPARDQVNSSPDSHFLEFNAVSKKKINHFCGSKTLSTSEIETYDGLKKNLEEGIRAPHEAREIRPPCIDRNDSRWRCGDSVNQTWREVSEEGHLAIQALFAGLPQNFSPTHPECGKAEKGKEKEVPTPARAEFNSNTRSATNGFYVHVNGRKCFVDEGRNAKNGHFISEMGTGKLKSRRTGFKPYKRCSVEAKENKAEPAEEKCNKRIRLEGDASM